MSRQRGNGTGITLAVQETGSEERAENAKRELEEMILCVYVCVFVCTRVCVHAYMFMNFSPYSDKTFAQTEKIQKKRLRIQGR